MGLRNLMDGRKFKVKVKFGSPNTKNDLEAWKKRKNMECAKCGVKRCGHAFANHDFREGVK